MLQLERSSLSRLVGAGLVLVVAVGSARADVLVVDPSNGPFTQIQAAVTAAQPNDVILVRTGTYDPVVVDNKPLAIVADVGAVVTIAGTTLVHSLPAEEVCVLSGLRCHGATSAGGPAGLGIGLKIEDNAGFVRVEGCDLLGAVGYGETIVEKFDCELPPVAVGCDAVRLVASGRTSFTACSARGGWAQSMYIGCYGGTGWPGGHGLRVGTGVAIYDSDVVGGAGGAAGMLGGPGGSGLFGQAFTSNSTFVGAWGGISNDVFGFVGGAGGHGAVPGGILQHIGSTFTGGHGGSGSIGYGPDGSPIFGDGPIFEFLVPRAVLTAPGVVREGGQIQLTIHGAPGALAVLHTASEPDFRPTPSERGVVLVRQPFSAPSMALGTIPANGMLQVSWTAGQLAPNVMSSLRYLQLAVYDTTTGVTLGSSRTLLVLDSAF